MKDLTGMTAEQMIDYANEIDPKGENNDLWAYVLFGGNDPNEITALINAAYNAGERTETATEEYQPPMSEWEARDGTAE